MRQDLAVSIKLILKPFPVIQYLIQSLNNGRYTNKSYSSTYIPILGRVFTSNFSLAKINCHRNFGKVFAFTHSNEKLKRKFVEESLLTYFVT